MSKLEIALLNTAVYITLILSGYVIAVGFIQILSHFARC